MGKAKRKPVKRKPSALPTANEVDQHQDVIEEMDAINELVAAANGGNKAALDRIRGILWGPRGTYFVDALGNAAQQARQNVIDRLAPDQEAAQIAIRQYVCDLQRDLEGPNANAIERLLVERIVMAWLQVAYADRAVANPREVNLKQADFNQRRVDHSQRRLLAAIKTLATVRRLALPIRVDVDLQVSGAVETRTKNEPALSASPVLRIPATRWQTAGANN